MENGTLINKPYAKDWKVKEYTLTTAGVEELVDIAEDEAYIVQLESNVNFEIARESGGVKTLPNTSFFVPIADTDNIYITPSADGQVVKAFVGLQY